MVKKELSKGRDEREGPGRFERASDDSRRGDPAWMTAGAEDFGDETPLLEQRRHEFEAERKAMQVRICCCCRRHMSYLLVMVQPPSEGLTEWLQSLQILLNASGFLFW